MDPIVNPLVSRVPDVTRPGTGDDAPNPERKPVEWVVDVRTGRVVPARASRGAPDRA